METSTQLGKFNTFTIHQFKILNPNFLLTAPTTTILKIILVQTKWFTDFLQFHNSL